MRHKAIKLIITLIICLGSGVFLISQIKLEKSRDRNIVAYSLSRELKEQIEYICKSSDTLQDIISDCTNFTCGTLTFSAKNNIPNGEANCVGYAQLTSAIINYAFQSKNLPCRAKPVVGKVYLFGIDLNNMAQKILPSKHRPFFKDHDFVEIDLGNEIIYIDSSLQDLTGLTFMQI